MALLPLLFFILASALFILRNPGNVRESILKSFLTTALVIGLSTEVLSLANQVTFQGVSGSWLLFSLTTFIFLILLWRRTDFQAIKPVIFSSNKPKHGNSWISIISFVIVILAGGITLFIALKAPPNNFDSMTYHMARIPHWIQNGSIHYYPTAIPRQNYSMPLAEYAILHLQVLSKGDHFANLIQWISFMMSILTGTLLAKELKLPPRGQWISAALSATLPMAVLQSTSTQNDLVVGIFCLSFAYFLFQTIRGQGWENPLFAALSMGLALATKGTAYIFCAGIGIGMGGLYLFGKKWEQIKDLSLKYALIIILALLLNTGIFIRNWKMYDHPLITSNERTLVSEISPGVLFANVLRNSVMHLSSPSKSANQALEKATAFLLGEQIDNPASTFQKSKFSLSFSINEDEAGNGFHFLLLLVSVITLPCIKADNKKNLAIYISSVVLSFLLFSLAFRWQPWGARLQTPVFLMGSPLMALLLSRSFKKELFPNMILLLFLAASIPYLLLNKLRPVLPVWEDGSMFYESTGERKFLRWLEGYPVWDDRLDRALSIFYEGRSVVLTERRELYFLANFDPYYWYVEACLYARHNPAQEIGLLMENNQWEYPLWVLLDQHASPGPFNIRHIDVQNESSLAQDIRQSLPELIFITREDYQDLEMLSNYQKVYTSSSIQILKQIK